MVEDQRNARILRSAVHPHVRHLDPGRAPVPARPRRSGRVHRRDGKDNQIYLGAFLEFLLILTNAGTAVVLYPIARRHNELLALSYVAARVIECVFIAAGIIFVLGVVSQSFSAARETARSAASGLS